jgi:CheY-like chemotaxis protein
MPIDSIIAITSAAPQKPKANQLQIMDGYTVTRQIKANPALRSIQSSP